MSTWVPSDSVVKAIGYLLIRGLPLATCLKLMKQTGLITLQEMLMIEAKVICLSTERFKRRQNKPEPPPNGGGGGGLESPEERARRQVEQRIKDNVLVKKLYGIDKGETKKDK